MNAERKLTISIITIWLFTISGIIGILAGYESWFLALTPLNLLVYLVLIIWNNNANKTLMYALLIPFVTGMITEFLGVNYGLIFGDYTYGQNLGFKIYGVPIIIGVNWAILTYCTAALIQKTNLNIVITSLIASISMVLLDVIMEVSAPRFDFWEFEGGFVPIQNYLGWFFTAFFAHILFQRFTKTLHFRISLHIFLAILVFFTIFLFL